MYAAEGGNVAAIEALVAMGNDPKAVDQVRAPLKALKTRKTKKVGKIPQLFPVLRTRVSYSLNEGLPL